jgi:hypothetical protein
LEFASYTIDISCNRTNMKADFKWPALVATSGHRNKQGINVANLRLGRMITNTPGKHLITYDTTRRVRLGGHR